MSLSPEDLLDIYPDLPLSKLKKLYGEDFEDPRPMMKFLKETEEMEYIPPTQPDEEESQMEKKTKGAAGYRRLQLRSVTKRFHKSFDVMHGDVIDLIFEMIKHVADRGFLPGNLNKSQLVVLEQTVIEIVSKYDLRRSYIRLIIAVLEEIIDTWHETNQLNCLPFAENVCPVILKVLRSMIGSVRKRCIPDTEIEAEIKTKKEKREDSELENDVACLLALQQAEESCILVLDTPKYYGN